MKLYVVIAPDETPWAECKTLKDAFLQAEECFNNSGEGCVYIDMYEYSAKLGLTYECQFGEFYFIRKGEAVDPADLESLGVKWYNILALSSEEEFDLVRCLCNRCKIERFII